MKIFGKKIKAFTLAELAVVFAIIAVIATATIGIQKSRMNYATTFMDYAALTNLKSIVGEIIAEGSTITSAANPGWEGFYSNPAPTYYGSYNNYTDFGFSVPDPYPADDGLLPQGNEEYCQGGFGIWDLQGQPDTNPTYTTTTPNSHSGATRDAAASAANVWISCNKNGIEVNVGDGLPEAYIMHVEIYKGSAGWSSSGVNYPTKAACELLSANCTACGTNVNYPCANAGTAAEAKTAKALPDVGNRNDKATYPDGSHDGLCQRFAEVINTIGTINCSLTSTDAGPFNSSTANFTTNNGQMFFNFGSNPSYGEGTYVFDTPADDVYTIYIDIDGAKGNGVLNKDILKFYITRDGTILPDQTSASATNKNYVSATVRYKDGLLYTTLLKSLTYKEAACNADGKKDVVPSVLSTYCNGVTIDATTAPCRADKSCEAYINRPGF